MGLIHYPIPLGEYRAHQAFDADAEASEIISVLAPLLGGEVAEWPVGAVDRHAGEVEFRLSEFARQRNDSTVLVWLGHGKSNDQHAALIVPGVASSTDDAEVQPSQFSARLADQSIRRGNLVPRPWTLVVIEACGAGRFAELVSAQLEKKGNVHGVALIGVGDPNGVGHASTARELLRKVVASYDENTTDIRLNDFVTEVGERLGGGRLGLAVRCHVDGCRIERPAIVVSAPLDVYAALRRAIHTLPADEQAHFARKGLGSDFGELIWLFVGRTAERERIVTHLNRGRGLLAVTGPAGSGKSAVLENVLLRSQPELLNLLVRAGFLDDDPPTEDEKTLHVDTWLLLSGLTSRRVVERLSIETGLRLEPASTEDQLVTSLLAEQRMRAVPLRVVADALDESRDPAAIGELLRALAAAGACIVVGTRASILEGPDHPAPDARELLDHLGGADPLWVRRDPDALRRYLERNLTRGTREPAASAQTTILPGTLQARIIDAVCDDSHEQGVSGREFLYARLLLSELEARPSPDEQTLDTLLHGNHRTIFSLAVQRIAEQNPAAADLLEALAYAQGNGIPRIGSVWGTIAGRIHGRVVGPDDLDQALVLGAPYVTIGAEHGQAVYRLAHRTFQEHFAELRTTADALPAAEGLIELTEQTRTDPNPYLVAHLAGHVGTAGLPGWESLAQHEAVLDVIDPSSVARELMRTAFARGPIPPALSGVLASHDALRSCAPEDRQGIRQLSAASFTTTPAAHLDPRTWSVLTASRTRRTPHLALDGHTSRVTAVTSFTGRDGRVLLATGGGDGTVRVWDPATGRQARDPLKGHTGEVTAVTSFTDGDGRVLLATGGGDGTVRVWDPATGRQVGKPLEGHTGWVWAVTSFTGSDGRVLLATGSSDGTVRVWDPATGRQVGNRVEGHTGWVRAVTSFTDGDGRVLLAAGGDDGTVRVWDPATGQQTRDPLEGHTGWVRAMTSFTDGDGRILLATGSSDGTVRVWDPATGRQTGDP